MNKEQVYDNQISPLMQQIIAICQEHGIAMLADFAIGHDGVGPEGQDCTDLRCSTLLTDGTGKNDPLQLQAINLILQAINLIRRRGRPAPMQITTTHSDGTKDLTVVV